MMAALNFFDLSGKSALVTGAASGIGRAVALGLSSYGARVTISDKNREGLVSAGKDIKEMGSTAQTVPLDVCRLSAHSEQKALRDAAGHQDILVHCAGVISQSSFADAAPSDFEDMYALHVKSAANLVRCFSPQMMKNGFGRIILLSSCVCYRSRIPRPAYAAAKGAIEALTRSLALEFGPYGITTNALAPGAIHTGMSDAVFKDDALRSDVEARIPVGRWGTPEDIAPLAVLLAGGGGSFINGDVITVDGGAHVLG